MSKTGITFKVKNKNAIRDIINNHSFNVNCPNCNNSVSFKGKQVGSQITCPFCKSIIQLNDNNFTNDVDKLQKSFNNIFK